ncbi:preprotein translocase subunit SecA [Finegoldia magna]|uniref:Protein translocase subunit SecA n=2 Tax=Finegoldia magna TaxID=1260 RepID=SECA_FINM2|nr:preprotein translocase subunit SecA [Finegoldia magna]B0S3K9.1 RecName: Full=Protein translocase subunit SecA [Finegoldia magna ATCC 29328]EGS35031.1 preprotein translocase, SecA subunit [Finegoldia magna SY403409CC001050417]KXA09355.1 preprotein translocase, SecA subunit [Finegoldia magna]MDU4731754.1 preprotein translocase subunit SecA [Finegoldia magna]MDU5186749.1 preprotein translocase subunit SecA [Finegoldia magna]MDU5809220.1 preprotein translocase subunit SecA [Finegoldia magna]
MGVFESIFGSANKKELKKIEPIIKKIESYDKSMQQLSDDELKHKTVEFKERLKNGETLDDILPEAFAVVREASYRVLGMKQYRVQLIGGVVLHQGRIAEMKTGEGKTLVATLPAYLNALSGKGVHVVTVNDYLAKRDKEWMGKVHEFLGLTVGVIVYGLDNDERRENYACDITYGTNNQYGFDYLRDNMVIYKKDKVQRGLNFAIVDEVDSILIDEARTPLIISGQGDESTDMYMRANMFANGLTGRIMDPEEDKPDIFDREFKDETVDFLVDEKRKTASLTEVGTRKAEEYFGVENLSDPNNMELAHHINQALKANNTMKRDIDYVVKDDEILIVDEFTGRIMEGRRYSDGLHQAIEAKEGVEVKSESKTLATVTFQNYFRMYNKLSGMTGTAKTEEAEFNEIYKMDVVEIPTNKPVARVDEQDRVYINENAKFNAIVEEIKEIHKTGQPILVGTISIEVSERLSNLLKKNGIKHDVLNAKQHEREAEIVAQAGMFDKVTIATNMAGRGTDILLGGNPDFMAKHDMKKQGYGDYVIESLDSFLPSTDEELVAARNVYNELHKKYKKMTDENKKKVLEVGGLYIIGTERHESRRIDNQLRGRSGRQGDPGRSRFFVSLGDNLMRLFGGETIQKYAESGKFPEDEPMEFRTITKAIERAQTKVESNNFGIRKNVLKYDDVMNAQRKVIYTERDKVLDGEDMHESIVAMIKDIISNAIDTYCQDPKSENWEMEALMTYLNTFIPEGTLDLTRLNSYNKKTFTDYVIQKALEVYNAKEEAIGKEKFREIERVILLMVVDRKWMDHIDAMDQLRQGIGLRAFGQQDPVRAYNNEGFEMFEDMNHSIKEDTVRGMFNVQPVEEIERKQVAHETSATGGEEEINKPVVKGKKIGRNDPCPCGSGKKYKNCCGKNR